MTKADTRWVQVLPLGRLVDQAILCVRVAGVDLLLVRDGDRIVACERACPHEQADLRLGRIVEGRLRCPRHLASFDLDDGCISKGWPSRPLRRYPVSIRDEQIWVEICHL